MRHKLFNKPDLVHFYPICGVACFFFLMMAVSNVYALPFTNAWAFTQDGGKDEKWGTVMAIANMSTSKGRSSALAVAATGTLSVYAETLTTESVASAGATVDDAFTVSGSGMSSGTAVFITVNLGVSGTLVDETQSPGYYSPITGASANIRKGYYDWPLTFLEIYNNDGITMSVSKVLSATLQVYADAPFELIYQMGAAANSYGGKDGNEIADFASTASLSFDLPDGTWITSDGGFYQSASAPIPEPATFFLIGSGLVGMAGLKRKLKVRREN